MRCVDFDSYHMVCIDFNKPWALDSHWMFRFQHLACVDSSKPWARNSQNTVHVCSLQLTSCRCIICLYKSASKRFGSFIRLNMFVFVAPSPVPWSKWHDNSGSFTVKQVTQQCPASWNKWYENSWSYIMKQVTRQLIVLYHEASDTTNGPAS